MKILAIDPGTNCGWAIGDNGAVVASGVWHLKASKWEGGGMRWLRLRRLITETAAGVEAIAYEEVRRHLGTDAAHVYGGIVAVIQEWGEAHSVPYFSIPVGTVKKKATGKGNADKDAMVAAAKSRWPGIEIEDDNHADALWILAMAEAECGKAA